MPRLKPCLLGAALCITTNPSVVTAGELFAPTLVQAGGRPIDVEREGYAAPFVGDFDGDGMRDLLVGQYHDGRLRIYRNRGTDTAPRFDGFEWFRAAGAIGKVPEG
jgi:hypothetical protein